MGLSLFGDIYCNAFLKDCTHFCDAMWFVPLLTHGQRQGIQQTKQQGQQEYSYRSCNTLVTTVNFVAYRRGQCQMYQCTRFNLQGFICDRYLRYLISSPETLSYKNLISYMHSAPETLSYKNYKGENTHPFSKCPY